MVVQNSDNGLLTFIFEAGQTCKVIKKPLVGYELAHIHKHQTWKVRLNFRTYTNHMRKKKYATLFWLKLSSFPETFISLCPPSGPIFPSAETQLIRVLQDSGVPKSPSQPSSEAHLNQVGAEGA